MALVALGFGTVIIEIFDLKYEVNSISALYICSKTFTLFPSSKRDQQ